MPKTRLTHDDRQAIREAIIAHKYKPIDAAHAATEAALAEELRVKLCGDYLKTMEKAPKGAFPTTNSLVVEIDGKRRHLSFGGKYPDQVYHRVFSEHYSTGTAWKTRAEGEPLALKIVAWMDAVEATKSERSNLISITRATLDGFRTFDDLLDGWPDASRFITEVWRRRGAYLPPQLPAVVLADLSAKLDLPPDGETEIASVAA